MRYTTIGSVIGTHAGPGAVVVAFFKNKLLLKQEAYAAPCTITFRHCTLQNCFGKR